MHIKVGYWTKETDKMQSRHQFTQTPSVKSRHWFTSKFPTLWKGKHQQFILPAGRTCFSQDSWGALNEQNKSAFREHQAWSQEESAGAMWTGHLQPLTLPPGLMCIRRKQHSQHLKMVLRLEKEQMHRKNSGFKLLQTQTPRLNHGL